MPTPDTQVQGLLLAKDFSYTLLDPRDLGEFTGLSTSVVVQQQRIPISVGLELVRWHLEGMFGAIEEGMDPDSVRTLRVCGSHNERLCKSVLMALGGDYR